MPVQIDGKTYDLVKEQRGGLSVYRADDSYARVGAPDKIARTVATHRTMADHGFPIPRVLATGKLNDKDYFVEQSLGEKTFRTLFEEDITATGRISEERFTEFLRICKHFLENQAKATVTADPDNFALGIHLDIIRTELPQYAISLGQKFERICERLANFPYVISHGDFNASNILPLGVIDLEDSFTAPLGFDAVSPISTIEWFPDGTEYEFFARYRFSDSERSAYFAMCDSVSLAAGFPAISPFYDDLAFCRGVWSCVRMHEWPKLQKWRYDKFIQTYLFY